MTCNPQQARQAAAQETGRHFLDTLSDHLEQFAHIRGRVSFWICATCLASVRPNSAERFAL
jgi:hypothetical protein